MHRQSRTGKLTRVFCDAVKLGYIYERHLEVLSEQIFRITDALFSKNGKPQGDIYTQFRIPLDKSIRISLNEHKVRATSKTGSLMEISYDPSEIESIAVIRGEDLAGLSVDTAGWRTRTSIKTVRFFRQSTGAQIRGVVCDFAFGHGELKACFEECICQSNFMAVAGKPVTCDLRNGGEPSKMRRLFPHIGFHKAGATTIQQFLRANHAAQGKRGYLFPTSVLGTTGHPNLVYELLGPPWIEN